MPMMTNSSATAWEKVNYSGNGLIGKTRGSKRDSLKGPEPALALLTLAKFPVVPEPQLGNSGAIQAPQHNTLRSSTGFGIQGGAALRQYFLQELQRILKTFWQLFGLHF